MRYIVETEADGMARFYQCDTAADASVLYHALIKSGEFDYVFIRMDGAVTQSWSKAS